MLRNIKVSNTWENTKLVSGDLSIASKEIYNPENIPIPDDVLLYTRWPQCDLF